MVRCRWAVLFSDIGWGDGQTQVGNVISDLVWGDGQTQVGSVVSDLH